MRANAISSRRTSAVILGLACAGVAIVTGWAPPSLIILPSCTSLPGQTCFGDHLNVRRTAPDGGLDQSCTTCLQARSCCDLVGACDQDPECVRSFQATQLCVIEGGPSAESRCKGKLTGDTSRGLYECMRSSCGGKCGVPDCTLDRAVVLFANPECDRCAGGACCKQINECYGSRRCKLIVECISTHCPRSLGPAMTALGNAPRGVIEQQSTMACGGQGAPPPEDDFRCITRCLDDFAPQGDASTTDDESARCLAFGVFACAAREKCGPACTAPATGAYSEAVAWPEDRVGVQGPPPMDASTAR